MGLSSYAISYVNMHIFYVPDGQQPRYEDRPATQQRQASIMLQKSIRFMHGMAISYLNMHRFYVPDGQQPCYDGRPATQQRQDFIILQKRFSYISMQVFYVPHRFAIQK